MLSDIRKFTSHWFKTYLLYCYRKWELILDKLFLTSSSLLPKFSSPSCVWMLLKITKKVFLHLAYLFLLTFESFLINDSDKRSQNLYSSYFLLLVSLIITYVWMLSKLLPEVFQVVLTCIVLINLCLRLPQGNNGTFRMFLEGDGGMFEVTPPEGVNFASFLIRVRNPTLLDFEKVKGTLTSPGASQDGLWWRDGESMQLFTLPSPNARSQSEETMGRVWFTLLFILWFDALG